MTIINKCPLCGSGETTQFLSSKSVPVHQNLLMKTKSSAIEITRGDLILYACDHCGFVFNGSFDLSKLQYGSEYNNNQACSPAFNEYMDGLVKDISKYVKDQSNIIEVGCGKGEFLKRLVRSTSSTFGYGFDPAYEGQEDVLDGRIHFIKDFYNAQYTDIRADIVVCRHVIEHVPDPLELLWTIRSALNSSPQTRVFFETPCVEWILDNQVVWDFFYEHCSYFSKDSLTAAFLKSGFYVEKVQHIFGGQYLWLEATIAEDKNETIVSNPHISRIAKAYSVAQQALINKWQENLRLYKQKGKVAIWGAGAKGATIANLLDPACSKIDYIIDLNPEKQHKYLPGTGHPIINYQQISDLNVQTAIVMNPNYRNEIELLLHKEGMSLNLVEFGM